MKIKKKILIKYKEMNFLALQLLGQQEISGASVQNRDPSCRKGGLETRDCADRLLNKRLSR